MSGITEPARATATVRARWPAALFALMALVTGCVSLHKGDLFPADRDHVFVAFFDNETFYRDVEFDLTNQVVAEVLASPGLHLSTKEEADIVLTGRVLKVRQHVLAESEQQQPISSSTSVTVEVIVKDAHTGEIIMTRKLSGQGQFVQALGQDIQTARREAYYFLARDIVRVLEEDF